MKYFSCFSGIGGFELGITQAYERTNISLLNGETTNGVPKTFESCMESTSEGVLSGLNIPDSIIGRDSGAVSCVGFSEIDKYATQIYQSHFPNHKPYGDITKINTDELPDFDCLVGGFPCQAFSIAGKRKGFEDTRGTLFFELARILKDKKPGLFVFENVKGLLSHDNGQTFRTIIATLTELGYDLQWQVLNSKNHGVPQNRERIFIIGHLRGTPGPKVFPFGEAVHGSVQTQELPEQISNTLRTNYSNGHSNEVYVLADEPNTPERMNITNDTNDILRTSYTDGARIRRLTEVECERLQGFPDGWTEGVSDTQRYKCLGNAVTVNVIRDIFSLII